MTAPRPPLGERGNVLTEVAILIEAFADRLAARPTGATGVQAPASCDSGHLELPGVVGVVLSAGEMLGRALRTWLDPGRSTSRASDPGAADPDPEQSPGGPR